MIQIQELVFYGTEPNTWQMDLDLPGGAVVTPIGVPSNLVLNFVVNDTDKLTISGFASENGFGSFQLEVFEQPDLVTPAYTLIFTTTALSAKLKCVADYYLMYVNRYGGFETLPIFGNNQFTTTRGDGELAIKSNRALSPVIFETSKSALLFTESLFLNTSQIEDLAVSPLVWLLEPKSCYTNNRKDVAPYQLEENYLGTDYVLTRVLVNLSIPYQIKKEISRSFSIEVILPSENIQVL